jgi:hypothetical protein
LPITIAVAITMSKPDYPHFDTQTLELRHYIDTAIAAISPDHWVPPATRELFADPPIIQVSKNETKSDDEEVIPSSYPLEVSTFIQVPATTHTSTRSSMRSRKYIRKFESQHIWDIIAVEAKEEYRKQREAKANRMGTGRTKAAEALAQMSQLLSSVALPFRSS